ncbi:zf-TFIIB domain-containing protein [Planctomycetota bacterium]
MDCPACGHELTPQKVESITLHVCDGGCGGMWFNWTELEAFDNALEPTTIPLNIRRDESRIRNQALQYDCPHCTNLVMAHRFIHVIDDILVDECPSCGGIWLSADEFEELRTQIDGDPEWQTSGTGSTGIAAESDEAKETAEAQRNSRFVNACRFLCCHSMAGQPRL